MKAIQLSLRNLGKSFLTLRGNVTVLKKVNLEINPGEFFVLLGPSGCGKSTLLNLIAGLEKPTTGEIRFSHQLVAAAKGQTYLSPGERDVAMIFQSYALYPHMTVAENIAFPLTNLKPKMTAAEIKQQVQKTAKLLQIDRFLGRKPAELSGGQRQRVAIGRAISRNPRLFLMDEPLSNLDAQLRLETRAHLKQLQQKLGVTTVYVTHDQIEAMTLGDRIAVLNDGIVQQIGTPEVIYNRPGNTFVARFIGSLPMNLFTGELKFEGVQGYLRTKCYQIRLGRELQAKLARLGRNRYIIGIRPDHLMLAERNQGALNIKIDIVENIGSGFLVYVLGKEKIIMATMACPSAKEMALRFRTDRVHIFDEQGIRLGKL
jgi:multiple sugar transport system ATP-binding protein